MHNRITIAADKRRIEIASIKDKTKFNILVVWFVLWTISGIVVFTQFFSQGSREIKLMYAIWMAFWAYFEYKASVLLTWRKSGKEMISFNENGMIIRNDVGGRGLDKIFTRNEIKNIRTVNFEDKKVLARVLPLYWNMGYETVLFDYNNKEEAIGLQLTKEEALQVVKLLKQRLNKP